ncbi:alpha/beta hydrolase [Prosthecobacter sp.]|uniref:alpha/beta hydrolase n=1 Tax=Prosthecobacter sp. TaxID=1965333 RepID=UPI001D464053|nr:alpha/beta hydrolase [Prosthecobacter sp.]MCB1278029.1 alpha/beta hydrolase [Prosthecobacter sp.]
MKLIPVFFLVSSSLFAAEPIVLKLWPGGAPEQPGVKIEAEKELPKKSADDVMRITNVTDPMITVFRPEKPNGTAVMVCPGGGYGILAYEHEGSQVCDFLVQHGVTGILLKYRVPKRDPKDPGREALQDAQRAMGLIRHHATEWGLKPDRIGILGFSAGGHLTIMTTLHANDRTYTTDPALDVDDATPSFAVPVYPAYLVSKEEPTKLLPGFEVTAKAPPMCFVHANDDPWPASGSALLYLEYKKLNLPCELHIYAKGGHGFGMRKSGGPVNDWPNRVAEWMKSMGYIP